MLLRRFEPRLIEVMQVLGSMAEVVCSREGIQISRNEALAGTSNLLFHDSIEDGEIIMTLIE